nr:MAG TPA: hypothetical protein [Siphoviridae sp. ctX8T1]
MGFPPVWCVLRSFILWFYYSTANYKKSTVAKNKFQEKA